jgi:phosphoadenosine phosphosulfate reductase
LQLDICGQPIDEVAIDIIREQARLDGGALHVAYSGGKDSDVVLDLVKRSGVEFYAVNSYIPIDPPELRQHVRLKMQDPTNRLTRWMPTAPLIRVAVQRGMLPTRVRRWCCDVLKERRSDHAETIITGVRWEESASRRRRPMIEPCRRIGGTMVHPIINWTTGDVWQYIRERGIAYCRLYDEGWKRLGCVLCPMSHRNAQRQVERWPQIAAVWRRISDAVFASSESTRKEFGTADAMWDRWLGTGERDGDDTCPLFDGVTE